MVQALQVKKLFVPVMSIAVFATLLLTPFSASAAASKIGSFNTNLAGTATNVTGCKTYSGKDVIVKITAKATGGVSKLKYKTLTLQMISSKRPTYSLGVVKTSSWISNTTASLSNRAVKGSHVMIGLKTGTTGIQMLPLAQYRYANAATVIDSSKLPNCATPPNFQD